jgi:hypothetical protein
MLLDKAFTFSPLVLAVLLFASILNAAPVANSLKRKAPMDTAPSSSNALNDQQGGGTSQAGPQEHTGSTADAEEGAKRIKALKIQEYHEASRKAYIAKLSGNPGYDIVKKYSITDPVDRSTTRPKDYGKEYINPQRHWRQITTRRDDMEDLKTQLNDPAARKTLLHISDPSHKKVVRLTDIDGNVKLIHNTKMTGKEALKFNEDHHVYDSWQVKKYRHPHYTAVKDAKLKRRMRPRLHPRIKPEQRFM